MIKTIRQIGIIVFFILILTILFILIARHTETETVVGQYINETIP